MESNYPISTSGFEGYTRMPAFSGRCDGGSLETIDRLSQALPNVEKGNTDKETPSSRITGVIGDRRSFSMRIIRTLDTLGTKM